MKRGKPTRAVVFMIVGIVGALAAGAVTNHVQYQVAVATPEVNQYGSESDVPSMVVLRDWMARGGTVSGDSVVPDQSPEPIVVVTPTPVPVVTPTPEPQVLAASADTGVSLLRNDALILRVLYIWESSSGNACFEPFNCYGWMGSHPPFTSKEEAERFMLAALQQPPYAGLNVAGVFAMWGPHGPGSAEYVAKCMATYRQLQ